MGVDIAIVLIGAGLAWITYLVIALWYALRSTPKDPEDPSP